MKLIAYSNRVAVTLSYDEFVYGSTYRLYVDKRFIGDFKCAHYYLKDLEHDHQYEIEVRSDNKIIGTQTIKTKKEKKIVKLNLKADGKTLLTKDIQKAINDLGDDEVLYFPKGDYLTGALYLKSGVEIYLEKDAKIIGSPFKEDYLPKIKSRFEGIENESYASLINIGKIDKNAQYVTSNIAIYGEGSILGGGLPLYNDISNEEDARGVTGLDRGRTRNRLINISQAQNVLICGLTLGYSASWNIHPIYSGNLYFFNNYIVSSDCGFRNADGLDPDSSSNVYIFDNVFDTGDDCIAIKSGKNPEGNLVNKPSKHIHVFDCSSLNGHGCSFGSEISGGVSDVDIYNCDFSKTIYGLQLKTTLKRGGYIKNVRVKNSSFSCLKIKEVNYNDDGEGAESLTIIDNINCHDIALTGIEYRLEGVRNPCEPIFINGFVNNKECFRNIHIDKVKYLNTGSDRKENFVDNATHVTINGVKWPR